MIYIGSTQRIICTTANTVLQYNAPHSGAAWVLPFTLGTGAAGRILGKETGAGNGFRFIFSAVTGLQLNMNGGTQFALRSSDNTVTLGVWQHLAYTYDGTATSSGSHIYVNGVETPYNAPTEGVTPTSNLGQQISIGGRGDNTRSIDGYITEVAVWSTTLSDFEIKQLASARVHGIPYQIQPSFLQGYWPLDDFSEGVLAAGSGSVADRSGKKLDGTPSGSPTAFAEKILSYV
jgi:hypothetical protein